MPFLLGLCLGLEPAAVAPAPGPGQAWQEDDEATALQNFRRLMDTPIITASHGQERLRDAPALTLVFTREDLRRRGYADLSELLDDLPGIDVVRPRGDAFVKAYWRGYRNTWGDPFLVMVDGMVFNTI